MLGVSLLLGLVAWPAQADVVDLNRETTVILLDTSTQDNFSATRSALSGAIADLPDSSQVGMRGFGSDGCRSNELNPIGRLDKTGIDATLVGTRPAGSQRPIGQALEEALTDLSEFGEGRIVLISTGSATCEPDPCQVAADLYSDRGPEVYVDVVGVRVDPTTAEQLSCIATKSGGNYYEVAETSQLAGALDHSLQLATRGYVPSGDPIEGSTQAVDAPLLSTGRWLDNSTVPGERFYRLPAPAAGESLRVTAITKATFMRPQVELELVDEMCWDRQEPRHDELPSIPVTGLLMISGCEEDSVVLQVEISDVGATDRHPNWLELNVVSEPYISNQDELPEAVDGNAYRWGMDEPSELFDEVGNAVAPIAGGTDYSSAPDAVQGRYADEIRAGQTLFYRIPEVGWGQRVGCKVEATPTTSESFPALAISIASPGQVIGLHRATTDGTQPPGETSIELLSPEVRYLNWDLTDGWQASQAGDYYCLVTLDVTPDESNFRVPFKLTVVVDGEIDGVPVPGTYTPPTEEPDDSETDLSGALLPIGIVLIVALMVVGGWLIIASFRR